MNRKKDITYEDRLDELKLDILHPNNQGINFVLVEGDSDIRLFRKLFDLDKCKVEYVPGGKLKVKDCVAELLPEYTLIVGILDADFSHLEETNEDKTNVFLTDYHDIEMTMLAQDDVLHTILFEYTDIHKNNHHTFCDNILETIEQISYLKWLNERENLRLTFKKVGFQDLISISNFRLHFNEYLSRVLAKSNDAITKDKVQIFEKIYELTQLNPDLFHLTNGHDALLVFTKYFRSKGNKGLSDSNVARVFRAAFTDAHFRETNLYKSLSEWATENNTKLFVTAE